MTDVDWPRRAGLSAALDEAAIVAITDRAGRILYCNDKFEAVSGYARDELIGQTHAVTESFYAITVERKIKHPGIVAITEGARRELFTDLGD